MKSEDEESKLPEKPSPQSSEPDQSSQTLATSDEVLQGLQDELLSVLRRLEHQEFPSEHDVKTVLRYTAYVGAWPPASVIREQESALPGSGERLLKWTENQTKHRHTQESRQVTGMERRMDRGQWLGTAIAILSIAAATATAISTNSFAGAFAAIGIAAIGIGGPTAGLAFVRAVWRDTQKDEKK